VNSIQAVEHADAREGLDQKTYTFSVVNVVRLQPGFCEAKCGVHLEGKKQYVAMYWSKYSGCMVKKRPGVAETVYRS
jgi:hypothetical protein